MKMVWAYPLAVPLACCARYHGCSVHATAQTSAQKYSHTSRSVGAVAVVEMFGVVTSGEPYYLVLELCLNGELKKYLQQDDPVDSERHSLSRLYNFMLGIAEGMRYLAELGFVHRDLAARNVLVSDT